MGALRVGHHREGLVVLDEFVNKPQIGLVVAVIVCSAMDYQEVAFQVLDKVDW